MRKSAVPPPALSDPNLHLHLQASQNGNTNEQQRLLRDTNFSRKVQMDGGEDAIDDNGVVEVQMALPVCNHTRTREGFGVTTRTAAAGRWCEGEKAIPLKKRRMSLEMNGVVVTQTEYKYCKMKSMTNKKCPAHVALDDNSSSEEKEKKKKKRPLGLGGSGRMMEVGSRCSRVNGRGWRCMQPTLVGYCLCDHHLGKARLRSINSTAAITKSTAPATTQELGKFINDDDVHVDKEGAGVGRKRKRNRRIGLVKAKSLSSLLCQPNTAS